MFAKTRTINRQYIGKDIQNFMDVPDLIGIQTSSYESFLQAERLKKGEPLLNQGLQEVFTSTFPIESPNGDMSLEFEYYELDYPNIKFSELECKQKGLTYSVPLKARIDLTFLNDGHIIQKDIYMGDIPLMTDRGTFIINGAERVVVSQIHRSPGVIFQHDKGVYSSRIIPYRGSWLEFEIDQKKELIFAKIDRKKKILGTIFLRALGYNTREEIIRCFYSTENVAVVDTTESRNALVDSVLASAVILKDEDGNEKRLFNAGVRLHPHDIDDLVANGVKEICVIKFNTKNNPNSKEEINDSLDSQIIINCFEREEIRHVKEGSVDNEPTREDALAAVYAVLMPGEPITVEAAEKDLNSMFFSERRYDLGRVGRYKLNKKFDYKDDVKDFTLIKDDIINTMKILIKVYIGEEQIDDIDHLGNRRIRCVGELLTNQLKTAFSRMERIVKERMGLKETDTMKPQDLISIKPIVAALREFYGSSQLSQFMDQVNPLSELTHKRRLNALGPGGLSRDRAGFEVRDVHYSHYGRMCPIETPEGPNIGLIVSLAMFTQINEYGFLEAPFRKVVNGKATSEVEYLSAMDED
ncbi:MAG: DNA-directed RNA polymerase subunit beta, partial [Treponema porcinum]|nr:DNA-directed RNA polymerase subunit beta [Treponema porcinum]